MGVDVVALRCLAAKVFSHFSCLPTPASINICKKQDSTESIATYGIQSKWKQIDSSRNDFFIMDQEYTIRFLGTKEAPQFCGSSSVTISSSGSGFPFSKEFGGKILWDIEQDNFRLVFTEYTLPSSAFEGPKTVKVSAAVPGTFVHVFCSKTSRKLKTIKLPTESPEHLSAVHGKVYGSQCSSTPFSSCRFCPTNSKKVVYLAEHASNVGNSHPLESTTSDVPDKSPFLFKDDWGEGLNGIVRPVIFLLDWETEEIICVHQKLEEIAPESKCWSFDDPLYTPDNKGIVFIAYDNNPYRLGLKYCFQRIARLMYWEFDTSKLECLSREGYAARWPRFSPDGLRLVWFEMPTGGPHNQCYAMVVLNWPPKHFKSEIIVPLVSLAKNHLDFPGLYLCDGVNERCWTTDSKGVVLSTTWGAEKALILVRLDSNASNRISRFPSPLTGLGNRGGYGSVALMDIIDDVLVANVSAPNVPNFLAVTRVINENITETSWINLYLTGKDQPVVPYLKGLVWRIIEHTAKLEDKRFGVTRFESVLLYPIEDSVSLQFDRGPHFDYQQIAWHSIRGLIVIPHGGPHSAFTAEWLPLLTPYIATGFACVLVNYRGSVGYGNSSIYSLPGKCGLIDVADCVQATEEALLELSKPDLPCVLFGGSHGGFLVLHMAGRYSQLFRAAVARNPVTNLVSMLSTTDIPDWCWTEAGIGLDETAADPLHPERLCHDWTFASSFCPTNPEDLARLAACSPIIHISPKWSVPVLMCIGTKDKRVPNEQGISFMRSLQAQLVGRAGETMCQTLCFPTEAHPIQSPAASKENFVRTIEWYYQALNLLK